MSKKGPGHQKRKIGKTAFRSQKPGSPSDMSPDRSLVTAMPVKVWLKSAAKLLILLSALVSIAGLSIYSSVKNHKSAKGFGRKVRARAKGADFHKDVAPIVLVRPCHRPNQSAPFSLLTYQETGNMRGRLPTSIAAVCRRGARTSYGDFADERRLTSEQIGILQQWAAEGAIEGTYGLARTPTWSEGWQLGQRT
jgi:hypothetical protein